MLLTEVVYKHIYYIVTCVLVFICLLAGKLNEIISQIIGFKSRSIYFWTFLKNKSVTVILRKKYGTPTTDVLPAYLVVDVKNMVVLTFFFLFLFFVGWALKTWTCTKVFKNLYSRRQCFRQVLNQKMHTLFTWRFL